MRKEYTKIKKIESSIIEVEKVSDIAYNSLVSVHAEGMEFVGSVVMVDEDTVTIEVYANTDNFSIDDIVVSFHEKPLELALNENILGRTFNGIGEPIDNGGEIYSEETYPVEGLALNPVAREYPRDFIQTGISAIDSLTTLIRGQKLPIFSGSGLPHNEIAAQIIRQAKLKTDEDFAFVFAAMGIKKDEAMFFEDAFSKAGVKDKLVMYQNLADSPIMERLLAPKCALTAAEYLAYKKGYHVLVIITDMTSYCEALREVSSIRGEIPSRKGYPGYLYSNLASLYERAGMIEGVKGSVTLIPILTMPNDDITHPVPDLTGYITEGQIVIDRGLSSKGVYPPINVLPSLSRLMKDGIGEGYTRSDHEDVMNQLYESYSKVIDVRNIAQIVGEEDLSDIDKKYLEFNLLEVGLDILDKKRKALMNAHDSIIRERDELNTKVNDTMSTVSHSFNKALASIGEEKLENFADLIPIDDSIKLKDNKFMQTDMAKIEFEDKKLTLSYSFYQTNALLDKALIDFNKLRSDIFKLAELDSAINNLEIEIRKANKKVNSLEKIQIPDKTNLIKNISQSLEEKEREEFSKTKIVKRNKVKKSS